jgi:hypothetical protein
MKKILFCVMVVLSCNMMVFGWGPNGHLNIANRMLEDPGIAYEVSRLGLSSSTIANEASIADVTMPNSAPIHQNQWTEISSEANFVAWQNRPATNQYTGWLIHNIADTAVPSGHCPACTWYNRQCMEAQFESQGETYGTPAWPNPRYYDWSSYNGNINGFYNNMYNLTQSFKSHNQNYMACRVFCVCMTDWIDPDCRRAALKNGYITVWCFLSWR